MVAKAGLRVAERARKQEGRAVLQYQLLQAMVRICGDDQNLMIETRVLPVKEILENQRGSVVLIVTLPQGAQYTNNQVVAAMQRFGENVKTTDVNGRSTAVSKKLAAGDSTGKPFPPTIEVRLKGAGGVQAPTLAAIRSRTMEIDTGDGKYFARQGDGQIHVCPRDPFQPEGTFEIETHVGHPRALGIGSGRSQLPTHNRYQREPGEGGARERPHVRENHGGEALWRQG